MIHTEIMDWEFCQQKFIRKVDEDAQRIKSIVLKARQRLKRAQTTPISEETASFVVEDYYEVIKEFLVAYLLKAGMRSRNHQCLISYFNLKNPHLESEVILIAQMSYFRNRLDYYGESVPVDFYEKNKDRFLQIINILEKLVGVE